jgi:hypothetical protein
MKVILTVDIQKHDQKAADRIAANAAAQNLLRAAYKQDGYFGATVEVKED